jgi:hypothetical protein
MFHSKIRGMLAATLFAAFAMSATASLAQEVKVPETAADHDGLVKSYRDKAATFRKEVEAHKQMAEAYKKSWAQPVDKTGKKNPWVLKMEKHCQTIAKDAEKLAADADKAADYHELRAKELQGK